MLNDIEHRLSGIVLKGKNSLFIRGGVQNLHDDFSETCFVFHKRYFELWMSDHPQIRRSLRNERKVQEE
jgi:hypothetical protein